MGPARSFAVIAGGVGAARLLQAANDTDRTPGDRWRAIVNVGDDTLFHGLRVCPDLDTILYTLAGESDRERGWGRRGETWQALGELRRHAAANGRPDIGWFALGDLDLGVHLWRTHRLAEGATLSEVSSELGRSFGVRVELLPATDDPLATRVRTSDGADLTFQEYFVRHAHGIPIDSVAFEGSALARPGPGVVEALAGSDVILIAPSNPILSVDPIRAIPGIDDELRAARPRSVAVSPIVGGRALKGPADRVLGELGHEVSVVGIARIYRDIASALIIDRADVDLAPAVEAEGLACLVTDTLMDTPTDARRVVDTATAFLFP